MLQNQDITTDLVNQEQHQQQQHTSDWTPDIDIAAVGEAIVGFLGNLLDGV